MTFIIGVSDANNIHEKKSYFDWLGAVQFLGNKVKKKKFSSNFYTCLMHGCLCNAYNMSGRVVLNIQSRAEGE